MKIGILGGGQLGRMLIQEALKYDDDFFVLDPDPHCSCAHIAHFTQGNFNRKEDVFDFGEKLDVVSIEIEHVNADGLAALEEAGVEVIPSTAVVRMIQQKILQKEFYQKHRLPSPDFQVISSLADEITLPLPFVQKLNTGGYDGKGVQVIRTEKDLAQLWDEPSVLEALVDIDKELSVIVARNRSGEVSTFPVTEMVADPKLNLLDFNICPAGISSDVAAQIEKIVQTFIKAVDSPGLFAIELFLDTAGKVWVNETAPRPHNSGHQTQEGNRNSQFEQFYRILKNFPLSNVEATGYSGMLNLIGEPGAQGPVVYKGLEKVLKMPDAYIHLYGKAETKPGRKMGHINVLGTNREDLIARLTEIKSLVTVTATK